MIKKIPITVGIIGHLDAVVTDEHVYKITEFFNDLQEAYPNSPVCLFSQLAPGADTAVAELFLKIKEETNREYRLIVPLPYEVKEYRLSFSKEACEKFDSLLSNASRYFVLEYEKEHPKNDLYRFGGKFVADSSVVLIAIWENGFNEKKGGTGDIIKYKIEGVFNEDVIENIFELKGSVISLACKRISDTEEHILELPVDPLLCIIEKDESISKTLKKIEEINKEGLNVKRSLFEKSGNDLYPDAEALNEASATIKRQYALADSLAIINQFKYHFIIKILFLLGIVIITFFEIYKHEEFKPIFLIITFALIFFAYLFFHISSGRKYHKKFLENRVLAEALRIQFFWNISNVRKNVSRFILRIHKAEFNWIKHIMLAIYGLSYERAAGVTNTKNIIRYWLTNQYDFFNAKTAEIRSTEKRYNILSITAFIVALSLMLLLLFLQTSIQGKELTEVLIIIIGVLLGVFALSKAYLEKRGYEQITNQYSLMQDIYRVAIERIHQINEADISEEDKLIQIETIFYLAGKEALIENGNWYMVFNKKVPEIEGL